MATEDSRWRDTTGDHALVPVPSTDQRTALNMFLVWSGQVAVILFFATGSSLGTTFTVSELVTVTVAGSLILAVMGALISSIGGITNTSTYVVLRHSMGYVGSWIWGVVISGVPMGILWFAVETWLFGVTINALAPEAFWSDIGVAAIWGGILMMLTALYGYRGLSFLSYLTVPMFIILAITGYMVGLDAVDGGLGALTSLTPPEPGMTLSQGVTVVVGGYIVGTGVSMDISRYASDKVHAPVAWILHTLIMLPFMLIGGGILTLATGTGDFAQAMLAAGIGLGVFLMTIFGFWTTNDNNLYAGSLAWSTFLPMKKKTITAIAGIVGTAAGAYVGFAAGASMDPLFQILDVLGRFLPAVLGVVVADFWIYRWYRGIGLRDRYDYAPGQTFDLVVWPSWVAALGGGWFGGLQVSWGIPSINAFVLSGVLYLVIMLLLDVVGVSAGIGEVEIDERGRHEGDLIGRGGDDR